MVVGRLFIKDANQNRYRFQFIRLIMGIQKNDQLFAAIFPFNLHNCIDMQMIILRNLNLVNG